MSSPQHACYDNDDDAIETALRRLRTTTPAHVDERLLSDAGAAMARPRGGAVRLRRAAALLLITGVAAAIAVAYFRDPGLTFAQVQDAVAKQTWVHVKYDDGREYWTHLVDGRIGWKHSDGTASFIDADGVVFWGHRDQEYIWTRPRPGTQPGNAAPADGGGKPRTAWDLAVAPYLRAVDNPKTPLPIQYGGIEQTVAKAADTLDGRKVVRLDVSAKTGTGERRVVQQIWADPQTRLPVQIAEWMHVWPKPVARIGKYDFPETGPQSIHDLGIARGLPMRRYGEPPADDVKQVLDGAAAAAPKFPTRYRSVAWSTGGAVGRVDVVWRDGERLRTESYIATDPKTFTVAARRSADAVLKWCATQTPINLQVYDGKQTTWRLQQPAQPAGLFANKQPAQKPTVGTSPMAPFSYSGTLGPPHFFQWPTSYPTFDASFATLAKDPDAPAGTIVLESDMQGGRYRYWLDPAKGYVCFRRIYYKKDSGEWKAQFDDRLEQLEKLGESWVGRRIVLENYGVWPRGEKPTSHEEQNIDVRAIEAGELPADAFDGKKLMEGDVQKF